MKLWRRFSLAFLATALAGTVSTSAPAATVDDEPASCTEADVPVTIAPLVPAQMHGTLCLPTEAATDTVLVLVPGGTYNAVYWDFPYQPDTYNFRQAMNAAGYATFVVDRLGTGESSRPPSALVTSTAQASAIHNTVQALRNGDIGGMAFGTVILGGHSLGSTMSIIEAATYSDVDAVAVTGLTHRLAESTATTIGTIFTNPAALDPAFQGDYVDPGYFTTPPGARLEAFHHAPTSDPEVVAVDEATKGVSTLGEVGDGVSLGILTPYSGLIDVPVLIAIGGSDHLLCGGAIGTDCTSSETVLAQESAYYTSSPCLEAFVLPDAGHSINLVTNTATYQQFMIDWLASVTSDSPAGDSCGA